MLKKFFKTSFWGGALVACFSLATGCASGGFQLTRKYARFVNSNSVLVRVILYIFTSFVFVVTMIIDLVLFNTMDFWEGKVAQGDYEFHEGGKTFRVRHELVAEGKLKRSTIRILGGDAKLLQEVVLQETQGREIEMFVDGKLRTRVKGLADIPVASHFNAQGRFEREAIVGPSTVAALRR